MAMQINPYVIFDGRCREAFSMYAQCLGGDRVVLDQSISPSTHHCPLARSWNTR